MKKSEGSRKRSIFETRTDGLRNTGKDSNMEFYGLCRRQKCCNDI